MQTYKSTVIYGKRGGKIVKNVDEVDDATKYIKYIPSRFRIKLQRNWKQISWKIRIVISYLNFLFLLISNLSNTFLYSTYFYINIYRLSFTKQRIYFFCIILFI